MEQVAHVEACRLCANFYVTGAEVEFVHLYQPLAGLEEQLQFVRTQLSNWNVQISDNDGLPQRICANCFTQFCNVQALRQQCVLAQEKLLQSFVGVGLSASNATADAAKQQTNTNADLNNDSALLNGLKIEAPVTSAELMASLDCLPTPTTSADVIASLEGMQMPASVAETLSLLTQELTTMQNGTLLDNSASSITTHANMDTKTAQTDVLQFNATRTTQNTIYYSQQTPITTVSAGTNTPVTLAANNSTKRAAKCGKAHDIDLEDMLQGSIIQKNANASAEQKVEAQCDGAAAQQTYAGYEEPLEDDMDLISCSDPEDSQEMDELEADVDPTTQTRISRNPFACQYCYCPNSGSIDHLVFDSSDALSQHFFDVHDPNLPYTCPYCPQKYSSVKQRDYHVRLIHPTAAKAEHCNYCKKSLRSPKELHEFNCQYVSNWHCDTCNQRFLQVPLGRFRTHQRHHAASKFKCRDCPRVFVRRANLEAHERMHRPSVNHTIHCDQCKEAFSNDYELRRHKYQAHNGALPVRCEYCHKGFVSMAFLSRHTQHFHPEKLNSNNFASATCSNCGCAFSSLHKLRLHLQRPRDENGRCVEIVHEVAAPYQERARQLRRPRLHSCQHCNKRFSTRATLDKHMSTHEAVTYGCNECTTTFENANELKQHVMQRHVKPRYLKCEHCEQRFCYMRELQQHQKVHAESLHDKALHCNVYKCGFVASCAQEARDHAVLKHKLLACKYCDGMFSRNRLSAHIRNAHASLIGVHEPNNNDGGGSRSNSTLSAQNEDSLAVASILNHTSSQIDNNDIMVSFEDNCSNGGEKVRVELVHQQTPNMGSLVLQEQTSNTFKPLMPTPDDMEENFLMNNLLDPDHEIIVT